MACRDPVNDIHGHGRGGQSGPGSEQPAARQPVEDRQRRVASRDHATCRLVDDVDRVGKVALSRQALQKRPAGGGGLLKGQELESVLAVPTAQLPDCLAADAAVVVVEDRQAVRAGRGLFVDGFRTRQNFGRHGGLWYAAGGAARNAPGRSPFSPAILGLMADIHARPEVPRAGAHPGPTTGSGDTLSREVKLLGVLLGQVISEQGGPELLELVERSRMRSIAFRETGDEAAETALSAELDSLDVGPAEALATAFSLYFQLVNLAEERDSVQAPSRRPEPDLGLRPRGLRTRRSTGCVSAAGRASESSSCSGGCASHRYSPRTPRKLAAERC